MNIFGTDKNDIRNGTASHDNIFGLQGKDTLYGHSGNDVLEGDEGADILEGGSGNDVLRGGKHNDTLNGGAGDDTLIGGKGKDTMYGGAGSDLFFYDGTKDIDRDRIYDFNPFEDVIDLTFYPGTPQAKPIYVNGVYSTEITFKGFIGGIFNSEKIQIINFSPIFITPGENIIGISNLDIDYGF